MSNLLHGLMNDARSLLIGGLILMAIAFVIMTWAKTRALVPVLGSMLLGAVVIAGVTRYTAIRTGAEDDIDRYIETDNVPLEEAP